MAPPPVPGDQEIEVVPVVVLSRSFPARPSSIPDIRDFVRSCLSRSPLNESENRAVFDTVSQALLDAAGPEGGIQVSFRIFPDHVEVDVLRSNPRQDAESPAPDGWPVPWPNQLAQDAGNGTRDTPDYTDDADDAERPFAEWMADVMRRQGLTMEATARQLGVSVKTVGRWVGGTTEPRLRDLRRIRELFGETPLG